MNNENILAQMGQLKMGGMQEAYREQQSHPKHADLSFEDRLSLLLDRELLKRETNRVQNLQRRAKLRQAASIEDICYKSQRGIEKAKVMALAKCDFVRHHHNVLIRIASEITSYSCAITEHPIMGVAL